MIGATLPAAATASIRIPTGPLYGKPKRPKIDKRRTLDLEHVRTVANAWTFAASTGRPLNALLTITWKDCGLFRASPFAKDREWSTLQTRFLSALSKSLKDHGIEPAYVWVRERVPGMGAHTHALVHLGRKPPKLCNLLLPYLAKRFVFGPRGLDISMGDYGLLTPYMQAGELRYMLKGIDHAAFRYLNATGDQENLAQTIGIDDRGPQGIIPIKRCGASQNLMTKTRKEAGWRELRDLAALHRILNPPRGAAWSEILDLTASRPILNPPREITWMEAA